jgi:hypothetical protein
VVARAAVQVDLAAPVPDAAVRRGAALPRRGHPKPKQQLSLRLRRRAPTVRRAKQPRPGKVSLGAAGAVAAAVAVAQAPQAPLHKVGDPVDSNKIAGALRRQS